MDDRDNRDDDYDSSDDQEIPQYINEENKRLKIMVRKQNTDLKKIYREAEQLEERHKIIQEHAKNVEQEQLHLQSLIDTKQKEIESQNHMKQVTQRQVGRLESEMRKLEKQSVEFQQRLNDTQVRIHNTRGKCQQLKLELNWNQQELQQWVMVTKQKEEDNVDLQKFRKQDQIKIRQLSLQIQKLTIEVARKQQNLEKEITQTQTSQIELDKSAQEFKRLHDQRHKLFQKWQEVTKSIAKRNGDIMNIGEATAQVKADINQQKEILQAKMTELRSAARSNKEEETKAQFLMRENSEKKNENKKIQFEANSNLQAEVEILKNKLSSDATLLVSKRNKIALLQQQLLTKKQRLNNEQQKYSAHQVKLKNELKMGEKFVATKNEAESRFKTNQLQKKAVESTINLQKEVLVKSTQDLFKLKEGEVSLYGQIQSNMATCRNLQSHINKLNQEFQRQQQLLYNAEYQIQLMERKVARAKGERTLEQKKDLQKEITQVAAKNNQIKTQHKILNQSVKKLDEDLRGVESMLTSVKQTEKHYTSVIEELTLENEMTNQTLRIVAKDKENVLVQHDIMKLEIKKIEQTLTRATDNVYSLENKKNQLEMSMQEREKEIQVHKDILLAEFKAAEDQRHKIAIELAERNNKVKNFKIKYQSLVQKSHGGSGEQVTEHSQAYYVIKAAQEREELQRKGDELSAKIIKAEKELRSLQCTLQSLKKSNVNTKEKFLRKGIAREDLQQKSAIEQQLNSASDNLYNMKHQASQAEKEYEEDMRRYTEVKNQIQGLNHRRDLLARQMNDLSRDLESTRQNKARAEKSLNIVHNDARNRALLTSGGVDSVQLNYDTEKEKNKTLFRCLILLGNGVQVLSVALDSALKARQIQLPSQEPSVVDMMSSRAMSVRSRQSQQSQQSQLSQHSQVSQQSKHSQNSQGSRSSGNSAINRVSKLSRGPNI